MARLFIWWDPYIVCWYLDNRENIQTPEYYVPHMDCFTEFFCDKPGESVHFSFDYFKTEKDFDRLQIKSPG